MAAPASTSAMMGPPLALARPTARRFAANKALPSSGADRRSAGIPASALAVPAAVPASAPPPANGGPAAGRQPPSVTANHDTPPPGVTLYTDVMIPPAGGRLHSGCTAFIECHRVRGGEVGPDQTATIATMANLLQVRRSGRRGECAAPVGGVQGLFVCFGPPAARVLPPCLKERKKAARAR